MRHVPDDLDPAVVRLVDGRLARVEDEHRVRIGWAVESGSRAWGFPSPDSDYDCRFLYVHRATDYLTPWPPRDVIETPLDAVLDVNGWDVRKAVDLMVRGNATVLEWLRSPIVYRGDGRFRELLLDLADDVVEPALVARHYLHLGRQQWERLRVTGPDAPVRLKGVFYALRPAAALHWMAAHPQQAVPPMRVQDLLHEAGAPGDVVAAVDGLVDLKGRTRELGTGTVPRPVRDFVIAQLDRDDLDGTADRTRGLAEARRLAEAGFREVLAVLG
ncbi:nucleotidyltransferase domain-containing protein [Thalassiella azotivora]